MADRERRILIVEDNPSDVELLRRELKRGGLQFVDECVETEEDFLRALDALRPDVVISDYALPSFNGFEALRLCRERRPDLPFIFVSGTMGEETAVGALTQGATDYLLKGQTRRLAQAVARAIRDAEQREARRILEAQLSQSQRLEAVGRLAGGVAHDFNNLLTAILGYADVAIARLAPDHPVQEDLHQIRSAGERAADLTRQLLTFSRKQIVAPRVIDVNEVVRRSENLLRRLIGENIELVYDLEPRLGAVRADPSQMNQVVMNLVVNARDAMPRGGRVAVVTRNRDLDAEAAATHVGLVAGPYVSLKVTDEGEGMTPEVLARLFEPFFTTKEQERGTGLGLAMVHGIVTQGGGVVSADSRPGEGAVFEVLLPRVDAVAEVAAPSETKKSAPGTETVLVAEDEPMVRRFAAGVLRKQGYRVLEAADGAQALKHFETDGAHVAILVTDVVMPGMSGRDLADRARAFRPGLKVLFLSGYTGDTVLQQGVEDGAVAFLQKPFTPGSLALKVRAVLDGKDGARG